MNQNSINNLTAISNLSQNQDGTLSGGFISVMGGRFRVIIDNSADNAEGINNYNCPCGPPPVNAAIANTKCTPDPGINRDCPCYPPQYPRDNFAIVNTTCHPDTNPYNCNCVSS